MKEIHNNLVIHILPWYNAPTRRQTSAAGVLVWLSELWCQTLTYSRCLRNYMSRNLRHELGSTTALLIRRRLTS